MKAFNRIAITSLYISLGPSLKPGCILLLRISIQNCWARGGRVVNSLILEASYNLRLSGRRHTSSLYDLFGWLQSTDVLYPLIPSKLIILRRIIQSRCSAFLNNSVFLSCINCIGLVLTFISLFKCLCLHRTLSNMSFVFFNRDFSPYNHLFLNHCFLCQLSFDLNFNVFLLFFNSFYCSSFLRGWVCSDFFFLNELFLSNCICSLRLWEGTWHIFLHTLATKTR